MAQVDLSDSIGYLLKEASAALRAQMEQVLNPLKLTITHYSCLELLRQRPGLSNSQLARGAFVTRQSMLVVLATLEERGLIQRDHAPSTGRARGTQLTPEGQVLLFAASSAVREVEAEMLADLGNHEQDALRAALRSCTRSMG